MDFYTKLFLINLVVLILTVCAGIFIPNDALDRSRIVPLLSLWVVVTAVSIPAWVIYAIITS